MKTIIEDVKSEIEINKSRFIALLYKVHSISEVKERIEEEKRNYKDATHYCYAYVIDDKSKSSDDGEPGGTAGVPIMEVLLKNDLNYVLCVVVRYFGGIKLGAGGLVRAYSKAVTTSLEKVDIVNLVPGLLISFESSYENQKNIDYTLKNYIIKKEYLNTIKYTVLIPKDNLSLLDNINYEIIAEKDIETK